MFESRFLVDPQGRDSNSPTFSRISLISPHNIDTYHHKRFPNSKQELKLKYREQIELILYNPDERIWNLIVSQFDIDIFGCSNRIDFEEEVLKPIIEDIAIKRDIDFEYACIIIASRIFWKADC